METDVRVKQHHADTEKGKYIVVMKGTSTLQMTVKLESDSDEILDLYPRESDWTVKLGASKQAKLEEKE